MGFPTFAPDLTAWLAEIAARIERLGPDHRDPERFHVDKDQLVKDVRRMVREQEKAA